MITYIGILFIISISAIDRLVVTHYWRSFMEILFTATFVLIYGLLIGSFLNVCIYRIPLGRTVVKGRSFCPSCGALIPWYLNIPVFSYLFLGGRCKSCKAPISLLYPAVELLNGMLYLALWVRFGLSPEFCFLAVLFSVLIIIALIDIRYQIIPNGLILILLCTGIAFAIYLYFSGSQPWYFSLIGSIAASLPLFLLGLIYKDGMGGGDIKLMAVAGLFAGWQLILLALFISAIYAGIYAIYLFLNKKGTLKTVLPFGPFLAAGIMTSVLCGNWILISYLSLF
jgi:leader peptidase (prepilin peptidase)/N-methyltransferase